MDVTINIIIIFVILHVALFAVGFHWLTTTESGWAKPPEDADQVVAAGERTLAIDGSRKGMMCCRHHHVSSTALLEGVDLSRVVTGYYGWTERLKESYLGSVCTHTTPPIPNCSSQRCLKTTTTVLSPQAKFYGCCIVPKKSLIETMVEATKSAGCSSITSIGRSLSRPHANTSALSILSRVCAVCVALCMQWPCPS